MKKNINTLYQSSIIVLIVSLLIFLLSQWYLSGEPHLSFHQEIQDNLIETINKETDIVKLRILSLELVEEKQTYNIQYNEVVNIINIYSLFIAICLALIIIRAYKVRNEILNK